MSAMFWMHPRFFVTGMGRSGTKWLADVLNQDDSVRVHHEPIGLDRDACYAARRGGLNIGRFFRVRRERMEEIYNLDRDNRDNRDNRDYAEVNSYLRYMALNLENEFKCPVVGLVRDGRATIRSLINQKVYQIDGYPPLRPPPELSYFGRVCWYWADAYEILLDSSVPVFRLEKLNTSYQYFSVLCSILSVEVTKDQWAKYAGHRVNASEYGVPYEWHEDTFQKIAGQVYEDICLR